MRERTLVPIDLPFAAPSVIDLGCSLTAKSSKANIRASGPSSVGKCQEGLEEIVHFKCLWTLVAEQ